MASYIPFVNSRLDCELVGEFYDDARAVRVSLAASESVRANLPKGLARWVDPGMDIFHAVTPKWEPHGPDLRARYEKVDEDRVMRTAKFHEKPDAKRVKAFVGRLLRECGTLEADWLSVPQLPYDMERKRSTINRQLAVATQEWAEEAKFGGKLVLPIILLHQDQVIKKTERDRIVKLAKGCFEKADADLVWLVDSSLDDQSGASKLGEKRFPRLLDFHRELGAVLPKKTEVIGGPYWGMNLVLWARALATYPAIGIGGSYRYFIAGGMRRKATARVALVPLRRQARVTGLDSWLDEALKVLPKGESAGRELEALRKRLGPLHDTDNARRQVAKFYREWFSQIESVSEAGRAVALYQDLSNAFVTGRLLADSAGALPRTEGTARSPSRVAEQLMLSCL